MRGSECSWELMTADCGFELPRVGGEGDWMHLGQSNGHEEAGRIEIMWFRRSKQSM